MQNSSQTATWLTPVGDEPLYDERLERLLSKWIRIISGLDDGMVRPRWTPVQSKLPPADVTWCAFGITGFDRDDSPSFVNQRDEEMELWRHETIEVIASFYGSRGQSTLSQFLDGISINQNHLQITSQGLSLHNYSSPRIFSELINNQWVRRYDVVLILKRKLIRTYNIKSLQSAQINVFGD